MKTAFIFPGQGSQYVGMGADLPPDNPQVNSLLAASRSILGYDITEYMFMGPEDALRKTENTQPALFVHEAMLFSLISGTAKIEASAGHSLGEISALFAGGVLTFEDALRLVKYRAELMAEAGNEAPGAMAAIVGLEDDKVNQLCSENTSSNAVIVAANYNAPGQVVISGNADALRRSLDIFKNAGARMVRELNVSGAFHSPLMEPARARFAEFVDTINFNDANIDVYVNVDGLPYRAGSALREQLKRQLVSPVMWTSLIRNMHTAGIVNYVEVGPGKILQGLVKRILPGAVVSSVDKYADVSFLSLG